MHMSSALICAVLIATKIRFLKENIHMQIFILENNASSALHLARKKTLKANVSVQHNVKYFLPKIVFLKQCSHAHFISETLYNSEVVVFNDGLVFTNSHKHTQATYIYIG